MKKNELTSPCDWWNWLDDIPALMETGIHGIAVSGLITQSENKKRQSNNLKTTFMEPSLFKIGDKILESRLF
jgi:thiamine-phosphate pyrophosphorylase